MNLGMLKEAGISCHLKDEYTITIDPLLSPALGGIKLMVEEGELAQASKLLNEAQHAYARTIPCPTCGEKRLEPVTETTYYTSWAQKLKSMLLYGADHEVKSFYRCGNCLSSFRELPR
jgi:DNA-directed RNA polymerase subunit RPC12/RpoP